MTWRTDLESHLESLGPLLRRRTPARFDDSPVALEVKKKVQAWNREAKKLLNKAPQGEKRVEAFQNLGPMSFTTMEDVRSQLKEREAFLRGLLVEKAVVKPKKAGVIDKNKHRDFKYAFCLTFAGGDRKFAQSVNTGLRRRRYKTFFDLNKDARTRLLGEPGPDILHDVFYSESELCLLFASAEYSKRMWTSVERISAQARSVEQESGYIIPIRIDSSPIKALPHTIGHLKKSDGVDRIVNDVIDKLKAVRAERRSQKKATTPAKQPATLRGRSNATKAKPKGRGSVREAAV